MFNKWSLSYKFLNASTDSALHSESGSEFHLLTTRWEKKFDRSSSRLRPFTRLNVGEVDVPSSETVTACRVLWLWLAEEMEKKVVGSTSSICCKILYVSIMSPRVLRSISEYICNKWTYLDPRWNELDLWEISCTNLEFLTNAIIKLKYCDLRIIWKWPKYSL